jgi:hypothetical protein
MSSKKIVKSAPPISASETTKRIEEAAYYSWLNRGRYSQAGDELHDWAEGEKEIQESLKAI